jgi:4-diphosphocytidyl-2-C-methyl-D-erythritol kinase
MDIRCLRKLEAHVAEKVLRYRAYGKVNLGLEVLRLRSDGYHEVLTVLQTVSLADDLAFEPARSLSVVPDHPAVPRDGRNLVIRAGRALQRRFGIRKGARVTIRKRLPVGGGMGGGSSDAACGLVGLSSLWSLNPDREELERIASGLGSDVPFFLSGGTCLGKGRGEVLESLPGLPACFLAIALPGYGVSTAWAYKNLEMRAGGLTNPGECIKMIVSFLEAGEVQGVARSLYNRLEEAVFPAYPDLAGLKEGLVGCGAMGALLSGSGSAVFGLFAEEVRGQDLGSRLEAPARTGSLRVEVVRPTVRGWEGIKEKSGSAS